MTVLVTGASGMIGTALSKNLCENGYRVIGVDMREGTFTSPRYIHEFADLASYDALTRIFDTYDPDRVIHLAALAHSNGKKLKYEDYHRANVVCAEQVFIAAASRNIPILHISTADVYGFVKGIASSSTELHPVSAYGKTKAEAERRLRQVCDFHKTPYTVFRFQPVYTPEIKRDIQKRYYLKYPGVAYTLGKGSEFEVLSIDEAVRRMTLWLSDEPCCDVHNVKDAALLRTAEQISAERAAGRARRVLRIPRPLASAALAVLLCLTGKNKYTYLLNKAVNPLRTE